MSHYFNKNLLILLPLFLSTVVVGQIISRKDKKMLFKANTKFDYGDYPAALKMYETLLPLDTTDAELNYKIGVCKFENKKTREQSKKYFDRTAAAEYPETYYYLGKLYHADAKFDRAISSYHEYINYKAEKEHTIKEVEHLVEKCYFAMIQLKNQDLRDVQIENMGNTINTEYSEYAPLISAQEDVLLFTSRRKNPYWEKKDALEQYYEDIYISKKQNGMWQAPQLMDTTVNTEYHDAGAGFSADGEKLLIYHTSEDHLHGHIYESSYIDNKWTRPAKFDAHVNSPHYNETSACFSPDGQMVIFSSDRLGGYGGKDLYSVKKAPNGKWAVPMNLGPIINTEYNEDAPFVHPFDSVIFFSSEGHQNMGGYDVYKSRFDEVEHFTVPENLGVPVNTVDDDIFFVLNASGSTGYISSKREGGIGLYDLYSINFSVNNSPLSIYNIKVMDDSNEAIKKVELLLTDLEKREVYGEYKSNPLSGKSIVISKPNKFYKFVIQAVGYEPLVLDSYLLGEETDLSFKLAKKQHE
ncbi:MAG TPA: hypothetical protein VGF30_10885 [Bacteroidia bacterium]